VNASRKLLEGRVALITGASRGIGREIASLFGAHGAHVVLAARTVHDGDASLPGGISDAVTEITAAGGSAMMAATNLIRSEERVRLVESVSERFGPVDILVNNAAVTFFQPIADFPAKRLDLMFEVQVKAPVHLIQLVLPAMKQRRAGWILNISSIVSRHPSVPPELWHEDAEGTVYGMCKAALERLTTGVALEVYDDDISVNCLSPNRVISTPGTEFHGLTAAGMPPTEAMEDFTAAALRLCSAPPRTMTGRVVCTEDVLAESH